MTFGPAEKARVLLDIRGGNPVADNELEWALSKGYAKLIGGEVEITTVGEDAMQGRFDD